jgi:hypothetical protein
LTALSEATANGHAEVVALLFNQPIRAPPPKPVKPVRKDRREAGNAVGEPVKEQVKADSPKVYSSVIPVDTSSASTPHHPAVIGSTVDGSQDNEVVEGNEELLKNETHTNEVSQAPCLFFEYMNYHTMHYSLVMFSLFKGTAMPLILSLEITYLTETLLVPYFYL